MKKLLFLFIFICPASFGQSAPIWQYPSNYQYVEVISKYDTAVLNIGNLKCKHDFVFERQVYSNISCMVTHGAAGCPSYWMDQKCICTICLRHLRIKETREEKELPDDYTIAVNKLNAKKK